MKSKSGVLIALSLMAASAAYSQVEVDDMYFTSKDRAKVLASKPVSFARISQADDAQLNSTITSVNPTDSYSGRGENPEFAAKGGQNGQPGEPQYFVPNYQPTGVNQNNTYSGYGSPYSGNYGNYYGMNSMYGNPYSSFYYPYSSMMGMGYGMGGMGMGYGGMGMGYGGMGMGYGGMGYGMGYPFGSMMSMSYGMGYPYMGFGSMYGMYGYGSGMYGYGSGLYGYGYPSTVIINNDGNSGYAYGKRSSRSSGLSNPVSYTRPGGIADTQGGARGAVSNGRNSSASESPYYQRSWRSNPSVNPSGTSTSRGSFWGNGTNSNSGNSSWGNDSRSSFGGFNNSRSSSGSGFSGGGFSGGGGGGGGGGGHSGGGGRGRP